MAGRLSVRRIGKGCGLLVALALASACAEEGPGAANGSSGAASAITKKAAPDEPAEETPAAGDTVTAAFVPTPPESPFAVNTVLALDYPLQPGDYVWDEEGVPDGPARIVVDIEAQRLYVYRAGVEIGRSVIIYGADDKPTPTGVFPILEKDIDHVSNLYDAPMPYMLRLTWDGVAIHGSEVDYEYATHGCVGIPDEFAEILFHETKLGDRVLVTHGWMKHAYNE